MNFVNWEYIKLNINKYLIIISYQINFKNHITYPITNSEKTIVYMVIITEKPVFQLNVSSILYIHFRTKLLIVFSLVWKLYIRNSESA